MGITIWLCYKYGLCLIFVLACAYGDSSSEVKEDGARKQKSSKPKWYQFYTTSTVRVKSSRDESDEVSRYVKRFFTSSPERTGMFGVTSQPSTKRELKRNSQFYGTYTSTTESYRYSRMYETQASPGRYRQWSGYTKSYNSYSQRRSYTRSSSWTPGQYQSWQGYTKSYGTYNRWRGYTRRYARRKVTTESPVSESVKLFNKVPIFYDRDTIMEIFNLERKGQESLVAKVMANYEHVCLGKPVVPTPPPMKRKPFIVIEGNHEASRKVLSERLAHRLAGQRVGFPRKCLSSFVESFHKGTKLRRAFLGLAMYASEYKVKQLWDQGLATVMDGYWLDETSKVIAWLYGTRNVTLPVPEHRIFNWPEDLLLPDIIFYLKMPSKVLKPPPNEWMKLIPQVYKRIKHPKVVIVIPKGGVDNTVEKMHDYINKYLRGKRDLSCTTPWPESAAQYDVLY